MGRHRNTTVCTFCKRRKIKCDKGKPCSSCVKYRNQICEYVETASGSGGGKASPKAAPAEQSTQDQLMGELRRITARVAELEKGYTGVSSYGSSVSSESPSSFVQTLGITPETLNTSSTASRADSDGKSAFPMNHQTVAEESKDDEDDDDDRICFTSEYDALYDNEPVYRKYYGPFSWYSSMKLDPVLNNLWGFMQMNFKKGKHMLLPSRTPETIENLETNKFFSHRQEANEGLDNVKNVGDKASDFGAPMALRLNSLAMGKSVSVTPGDLSNIILSSLPTQKATWLLIHHFFNSVYPVTGVVDEDYFRRKTTKLIGPEDYKDVRIEAINIEKKLDFIHAGVLLVVLKLSYISLLSNIEKVNKDNLNTTDPSKKAQDLKCMLSHPMDMCIINVVELCFNQFNLLSTVNISILQLGVLILFYRYYGPELGEGTDNSDALTLNSILMQIAYSAGCHREPTKLKLNKRNPKFDNLCRKIWYNLLILDSVSSITNGDPSNSRKYSFDVFPAYLEEDGSNANCRNLEMEITLCKALEDIKERFALSQEWLHKLAVLDKPIKISELDAMTARIYDFVEDHAMFKTIFDDVTSVSKYYLKTFKLKFYFQASFFAISIYFHISVYYYKRGNYEKGFSYGFDGFELLMKQLLPLFTELLTNTSRKLNSLGDWVINPILQSLINKALIINLAYLLRMRLYLVKKSNISDTMRSKVQKCGDLLTKSSEIFLTFMASLSNRYYYAWRITKIQGYLLNCCYSSELQNLYTNFPFVGDLGISESRVDKLNELLEDSLTQLEITKSLNAFNDILKVNTEDSDSIWFQVLALRRVQRDKERSSSLQRHAPTNNGGSTMANDFAIPAGTPPYVPQGFTSDDLSTDTSTPGDREAPEFAFDALFGFGAIDEIFEDSIGSRSAF